MDSFTNRASSDSGAAGPSQEVNESVSAAAAQAMSKRKGNEDSLNDDAIDGVNEAKRSKLIVPPSPLQVLASTVTKSSDDASPQHATTSAGHVVDHEEESSTIQQIKDAHAQYVTKLEASGSSIENEMTKATDLLYVVTSISRRDCDPFGPCLHGIYTTCQNAQKAARKTFERVSESYRNGDFVSHENRVAKFDTTNYLIPGVEGAFRPLFEVFKQEDEYPEDCTGVAINAVHIGTDVAQSLPYIQDSSSAWIKAAVDADIMNEKISADTERKNLKVHALFSYKACGRGDEKDVDLIGIYKDREEAITRARAFAKDVIDDEQIEVSYNLEVTDGEIIVAENKVSVSIETVILDDEDDDKYGNEIEFSIL